MTANLLPAPMRLRDAAAHLASVAWPCGTDVEHIRALPADAPWRPYTGTLITEITAHTCPHPRHATWYLRGTTCGLPRLWNVRTTKSGPELTEAAARTPAVLNIWWHVLTRTTIPIA
ncbi:hypothetical protein [Actinomadura atramentaria]|uniref:hypothetical protein n=1 Tax=Actinomadura atramentaria TaxID=1990 RepID=UPI00037D1B28|nr:hypothetical protein [Actinomadura atramentaria]